ncbi:Uu.00g081090.m01.CDS01 [Anthostomella pinea]|uniref:Uu.00g081090.m01.CDS01 n=1 Tax=Anthostomella pinea TaxID=933095 RepID=A0AAI8VFQ8_9PEZI|nr:Uu.00g081090.m01.CDS01 [Anthostomella pinea]
MSSAVFTSDRDIEKGSNSTVSPGNASTSAMPYVPTKLASANPLGLLAFATSLFMLSLFGLKPRGIETNNIIIANMIFLGGVAQVIAGIIDFVAGNAFGATVFSAYGAFNLAYSLIFLPGSGILASYADGNGGLKPEFEQAVALFVWQWFIITVIFTIGAIRSNYVLLSVLSLADVTLILIATGNMTGNENILRASSGFGFASAIMSYYAAAAYLYVDGTTPFELPLFPIKRD